MKTFSPIFLIMCLLLLAGCGGENPPGGSHSPSKTVKLTSANFDEMVLNSEIPVMVDFWAPWCGPCRMMEPVIEELAIEFEGRAIIGKLNTDDNPDIAGRYGPPGLPAFAFFKDGKAITGMAGARPKEQLVAQLEILLAPATPPTESETPAPAK